MSYALVSDVHIDAVVTAARHWADAAASMGVEESLREQLDLARRDPDALGLALMTQNWNTFVYGGDPDELDEDEVAFCEQEATREGVERPTYVFEEMPGTPNAETVLRLLQSYGYQSNWEGTGLGEVTDFVEALQHVADIRLGGLDHEAVQELPRYVATPWLPDGRDRDLFVRLG